MKHFILYGHDGSGNHGCEALARTAIGLLNDGKTGFTLVSTNPEEEHTYGLDSICRVIKRGEKKKDIKKDWRFVKAFYALKIKHDYHKLDDLPELQALSVKKGDIAIAIGGDSYCYGAELRNELIRQHKLFKDSGIKTVFWGCSIEQELLNDEAFVKDMQSFDLITARESISYNALKRINKNTILVADSAFTLKQSRLPMPDRLEDAQIVGINMSPLIEKREGTPGITRENYEELIDTILSETNYKILLIPHVVWNNNDDRTVHSALYEKFADTGRVVSLEDHNCMELKGYISRCRFFIGARTHATIAAYSTGVPTLVVGYSTKSRGIAKDLFGTDENYVIPVQGLKQRTDLANAWHWLQDHEQECKDKLASSLPVFLKRVEDGRRALLDLK